MSLRIGSVVLGVRDVPRAVEFWTAALACKPLREPDVDWAILVPEEGPGQQIAINLVASEPESQRHHLNLDATNQAVEVDRLLSLGASRVPWKYEPGSDCLVLAAPDGNRFCVIEKHE